MPCTCAKEADPRLSPDHAAVTAAAAAAKRDVHASLHSFETEQGAQPANNARGQRQRVRLPAGQEYTVSMPEQPSASASVSACQMLHQHRQTSAAPVATPPPSCPWACKQTSPPAETPLQQQPQQAPTHTSLHTDLSQCWIRQEGAVNSCDVPRPRAYAPGHSVDPVHLSQTLVPAGW